MTRRLTLGLAAVLTIGACTDETTTSPQPSGPEFITGNFTRDFTHTWVGLAVFYADGVPSHSCSGSLISATTFLTAGHCVAGVNSARIWFDQNAAADRTSGYFRSCGSPTRGPESCVFSNDLRNFGFPAGFPNTKDVGVVLLDPSVDPFVTGLVARVGHGDLAPVGTLDRLANRRGQQDVTFVSSGYGDNQIKPFELWFGERMMASSKLVNLQSALTDGFNVQTSANPGNGRGGTCFGDSGGPLLYQGQIVGVTSFGLNRNCKGVDFAYRVDRKEVHTWVASQN